MDRGRGDEQAQWRQDSPSRSLPDAARAGRGTVSVSARRQIETFADPCAGDGDLVRHLEGYGLICTYSGDIQRGQDALACCHYNDAQAIISNIPYTRIYMHESIEHFLHTAPQSWLLLDHAWSASQASGPFIDCCSDIIPVKRITWFDGTTDTEKRSHCWYRFDLRHSGGPRLLPWGDRRTPVSSRRCRQCGTKFRPPLPSAQILFVGVPTAVMGL